MTMFKDSEVGKRHVFNFNPQDNGGESLTLVTDFFHNGDPVEKHGIYTNQILSLQSYGNSASFNLSSATLTPENLRKLANELESAMIKARSDAQKLLDANAN